MEALPPLLPRPREEDVVEVDGRDCTGILELSADDITIQAQAMGLEKQGGPLNLNDTVTRENGFRLTTWGVFSQC